MPLSDLNYVLFWWLEYLLIGALFLPLTTKLFSKFWDKGYIFSKTLGIILLSYVSLNLGILKLVPYSQASLVLLLIIYLFFLSIYLSRQNRWLNFKKLIDLQKWTFLGYEVIFLLILTLWSFVRAHAPDIEGLEKFMDWGFVNSILRSTYFPPIDMWFSGQPINYYYFGHFIFATLTKLSSLDSTVTYNLSIASLCALTFTHALSFSSNFIYSLKNKLPRSIALGLVSALLITFGGNLHSIYKIAKIDYKNNNSRLVITIPEIQKAAQSYWYPDATRFIGFDPDVKDKTIHEFPLYSFVVADLHGHLNNIPLVLLFVAFLFHSLSVVGLTKKYLNLKLILISAFLLSVGYMTNAWDLAVYGLLFGFCFFLYSFYRLDFLTALSKTILHGLLLLAFWFIFSLPFNLHFESIAQGIVISDTHSPFYQLLVLYGGFWLICLPTFVLLFWKFLRKSKELVLADIFFLGVVFTATILIIIPELIYIKDIYIFEHRRANTMFKLVYQAFMLYSLASGYALLRFSQLGHRFLKPIYKLIFILVFSIHLIYSYFAIKSYYSSLSSYRGLYGLGFLQTRYPDNYAAFLWFQENVSGQPNIVEAVGDSYTDYNLISAATGLPTIEGWIVHEWLWRGGYDKPAARQEEVKKIYTSKDSQEIRSLLYKYKISYLFVGAKERDKYPELDEQVFTSLGAKIVFQSGNTKIFKVN